VPRLNRALVASSRYALATTVEPLFEIVPPNAASPLTFSSEKSMSLNMIDNVCAPPSRDCTLMEFKSMWDPVRNGFVIPVLTLTP
jgi:hypothetical protein